MGHRCHVNREEKHCFNIENTDDVAANSRIFEHHGLPTKDVSMEKGTALYNANNKTWQCQICMRIGGKYGRLEIINRLNSKHKQGKRKTRKRKYRQVLIAEDDAINREVDCGFAIIPYGQDGGRNIKTGFEEGESKCPKRGGIYNGEREYPHIPHVNIKSLGE